MLVYVMSQFVEEFENFISNQETLQITKVLLLSLANNIICCRHERQKRQHRDLVVMDVVPCGKKRGRE